MRILIIGCGNIGYYHLWAISHSEMPNVVDCVDPCFSDSSFLDQFRKKVSKLNLKYNCLETIPINNSYVLCVVATNSNIRYDCFRFATENNKIQHCVLEKVLCSQQNELQSYRMTKNIDCKVFVNCWRRATALYNDVAALLPSEPRSIKVVGNNIGLLSNTIHFLDVGEFLGLRLSKHDISSIQSKLKFHHSKRKGFSEASGVILINNKYNQTFRVESTSTKKDDFCILHINCEKFEYTIYEGNDGDCFCVTDNKIKIENRELPYMSECLQNVYSNMIRGREIELTSLEDSIILHETLFDCIQLKDFNLKIT